MKAEQLIRLLQEHLGEDIKVYHYDCDDYGNPYLCTCDITGILEGSLSLECLTRERVDLCDSPCDPPDISEAEIEEWERQRIIYEQENY